MEDSGSTVASSISWEAGSADSSSVESSSVLDSDGGSEGGFTGGPEGGPVGGPDGGPEGGPVGGLLGGPVGGPEGVAGGFDGVGAGDASIPSIAPNAPSSMEPSVASSACSLASSAEVFFVAMPVPDYAIPSGLNSGSATAGCLRPAWCRGYHAGLSFLRPGFNSRSGRLTLHDDELLLCHKLGTKL